MKKTQMNAAVNALTHAEWNPRTAEELSPNHPEMVKLIASIRELGVVQPVAVWVDGGKRIVIAGNRRFAAAAAVGLKEIPAVVFTGIDEAQAREITRVENEVRLGIDPIKDAGLIGSMLNLGYNQKEIAAHFGVSEATICRRVKLLDLQPAMRELATGGKISTDALEQIALYPEDVQMRCLETVKRTAKNVEAGTVVRWSQLSWTFNNETKELGSAKFDTSACVNCPKRTGAQGDLWGDVEDGQLGRCLDCKCFESREKQHIVDEVREVAGEAEIVSGNDSHVFWYEATANGRYSDAFGERRAKKRPALWYWVDRYDGSVSTMWGPGAADWKARMEREKEDSKAAERLREEKIAKRREAEKVWAEWDALKSDADEKFREAIGDLFKVLEDSDEAVKEALVAGKIACGAHPEIVAEMVYAAMTDWEYRDGDPVSVVKLVTGNPKLAKAVGIRNVAEIEKAIEKREAFDREHPEPQRD